MTIKVFLGGTTADSKWRDTLIPLLEDKGIEYFNPVVEDWTKERQDEEIAQRKACDVVLYVLTPLMRGILSVVELTDDSNKRPQKTVFCFLPFDIDPDGKKIVWTNEMKRSIEVITRIVVGNGTTECSSISNVADTIGEMR